MSVTQKTLRWIPAIYFMLLGTFAITMESLHSGFSLYWFCLYAILFLPIVVRTRLVWTTFGFVLSLVFGVLLLNQLTWFVEYRNGAYFKYPFDSFVVGFPFIVSAFFCAVWIFYAGVTSRDRFVVRLTTPSATR